MIRQQIARLAPSLMRFGLVGGTTTGAVYLAFIQLLHLGIPYPAAATAGWALGVGISYLLNRSFTFRVAKPARAREFGTFLAGALVQLALGLSAYWVLMGVLRFGPSLAFVLNIGLTASFSFVFMRWVAFAEQRPRAA